MLLGYFLLVSVVSFLATQVQCLHLGEFQSELWQFDPSQRVEKDHTIKFVVALQLRNIDHMRDTFLSISDPRASSYGSFLSLADVHERYGPTAEAKQRVLEFFSTIKGATVQLAEHGDLIEVSATVGSISSALNTELAWVTHVNKRSDKRSIRCASPLSIPHHIQNDVSFISLNAPVNHVYPRAAKPLRKEKNERSRNLGSGVENALAGEEFSSTSTVGISSGNMEALVHFTPYCGDGSINTDNPPCSSFPTADQPVFTVQVTSHAGNVSDPYELDTDPLVFTVNINEVYCYNSQTAATCSGNDGTSCTCITKISPLPMYTQLRANVTASFPFDASPPTSTDATLLGRSDLFALTDVATSSFLSELYSIPKGIAVRHGSNQSVAEFYGEFYSNADLMEFLALSGLPNATIPDSNVYGDLANDQQSPGGEAQLDVEYIMALAPGAETFFYSMGDYNPNDPVNTTINEGFLAYLTLVNSQPNPPLVHSLSYGDVEAQIFNATHNGSVAYGERCDQEFMKMGLRGLTVVFSSGDDGIGSSIVRDDPEFACQQSYPEWPASSPYVTAVGATQMTDQYLPVCGKTYANSGAYPNLPLSQQLNVQCSGTGETVCSSTLGGVITSGGGFSAVNNRSGLAPWQEDVVNNYLRDTNAAAYPPHSYFNYYGRGYPDVATYGSNYLIYLNGRITRESGTSASAPVFAAMVTLWNDIRLAYDQPPMGFIAPFLYYVYENSPDAFTDVVTGDNACGAGHSLDTVNCCNYAFAASPGWDAVTGLGSPNFDIISNLVLNNASEFPNLGAYPDAGAGPASPLSVPDDGDDDAETSDEALAGMALGAVALIISIVAMVLACQLKTLISGSGDKAAMFSGGSSTA